MSRTRKLDPVEVRVLGALLEKQQTTPEAYPLTTNALIAACNQKTNREPVTDLTETQVTEALDRLREDVLVWRSESARSERWAQRLDRRWELEPGAKAVMTLLLLRGPQTAGELRTRSDRLHAFESVEQVEETLQRLATGIDALVRQLPRRSGQREARWTHLAGGEDEAGGTGAGGSGAGASGASVSEASAGRPGAGRSEPQRPAAADPHATAAATHTAAATRSAGEPRAGAGEPRAAASTAPAAADRLDRLEAAVRRLEATVAALESQLSDLRSDLGDE